VADADERPHAQPSEAQRAWHRVPIPLPPPGETRPFELRSRKLLLCNAAGTPYVIEDSCPHVRVSMAGAVLDGCVLECPHHGGRLDVRDGRPLRLPIRHGAETYAVRGSTEGGLEVEIGARGGFAGRSPARDPR
jgi:3-phenylpropionate/trans-cinnamate dioxygenase ferredoxin subunit